MKAGETQVGEHLSRNHAGLLAVVFLPLQPWNLRVSCGPWTGVLPLKGKVMINRVDRCNLRASKCSTFPTS